MKHRVFLMGLVIVLPVIFGASYTSAADIPAPSASIADAVSELAPQDVIVDTYEKLPEVIKSPLNGTWEALKGFVEAQGAQFSMATVENAQVDATTFINRSLELIKDPALIMDVLTNFVSGEYNRVKEYLGF